LGSTPAGTIKLPTPATMQAVAKEVAKAVSPAAKHGELQHKVEREVITTDLSQKIGFRHAEPHTSRTGIWFVVCNTVLVSLHSNS
jgi:hypothetical protein